MSTVLYIQASPRGNDSFSIRVADAFLKAYTEKHPEAEIDYLNLFKAELPPFDAARAAAKYTLMRGEEVEETQLQAWNAVERIIERFKKADVYLLAVPMWNFGIPYVLKQYIDHLVQPGYTFDPMADKGKTGLLTSKSAFVAYARGGDYKTGKDGDPFDFQQSYLEAILGFIGIDNVRSVIVQPTLAQGPDAAAALLRDACKRAAESAAAF